ncbi:MAG: aspartyl protease family protein, partial [Candidatus Methylomirabilis sp.]|nr:aspartyl protease family protein [Deltaproteobacteria bacterium]
AMVDTGATATVVTPRIVTQLGLSPVGSMSVNTPNAATPNACYLYDVSVGFLPNRARISSVRVIAATLSGQPIDCLIGRDILAKGILVYIGYDNQFTLSF